MNNGLFLNLRQTFPFLIDAKGSPLPTCTLNLDVIALESSFQNYMAMPEQPRHRECTGYDQPHSPSQEHQLFGHLSRSFKSHLKRDCAHAYRSAILVCVLSGAPTLDSAAGVKGGQDQALPSTIFGHTVLNRLRRSSVAVSVC